MRKQAILIIAHKDFNSLLELVRYFGDRAEFPVYIHVDRRSRIYKTHPRIMREIRSFQNVCFFSTRYNVGWGGLNSVRVALHLAETALKDQHVCRVHLLTGQDYPAVTSDELSTFFEDQPGVNYLEYCQFPISRWRSENGGFDRISYYRPFDMFKKEKYLKIDEIFLCIQKKIGFARPFRLKDIKLFGGSAYWSLTRELVEYVVRYTRSNPHLLKRLKLSFGSDEIYFQTVVMNSPYASSVVNRNLRYIDWSTSRGGCNPAVLDETDFEKIITSGSIFARKFDSVISIRLRQMLKNRFIACGSHDER